MAGAGEVGGKGGGGRELPSPPPSPPHPPQLFARTITGTPAMKATTNLNFCRLHVQRTDTHSLENPPLTRLKKRELLQNLTDTREPICRLRARNTTSFKVDFKMNHKI